MAGGLREVLPGQLKMLAQFLSQVLKRFRQLLLKSGPRRHPGAFSGTSGSPKPIQTGMRRTGFQNRVRP